MKKISILAMLLAVILCLSSCQMEEVIPEQNETFNYYYENEDLYAKAVDEISTLGFNCLISRSDFYSPAGAEDIVGLYVQNMNDESIESFENKIVQDLFSSSPVKLIDFITIDNLSICAFDMCIPGRSFDYGVYFVSEDRPVYIGDPSIDLVEKENGFAYEKPASYGTQLTFYTEKIADHYYYYEIM